MELNPTVVGVACSIFGLLLNNQKSSIDYNSCYDLFFNKDMSKLIYINLLGVYKFIYSLL
jgi:hypothetical protein